ncbi:hypothetical protein niasHT_021435 [Heterodera trifolii]
MNDGQTDGRTRRVTKCAGQNGGRTRKHFWGVCALHKAKAKCERRRRGGKEGQMKGMNGWGKGSKETLLIQQHGRATQQQRVQKGDGGMEEADDERLDKLSSVRHE